MVGKLKARHESVFIYKFIYFIGKIFIFILFKLRSEGL